MTIYSLLYKVWQLGWKTIIVCMIAATIGCNGNRFMFSSGKDMVATPSEFGLSYEDVWFNSRDGERLNAWLVPGKSNIPMAIFFHGNAANISSRVDILRNIIHPKI